MTYLLFLKMADEQSRPPFNKAPPIPKGKDWLASLAKDGDEGPTVDAVGDRLSVLRTCGTRGAPSRELAAFQNEVSREEPTLY